jgi:hypothetical protein
MKSLIRWGFEEGELGPLTGNNPAREKTEKFSVETVGMADGI